MIRDQIKSERMAVQIRIKSGIISTSSWRKRQSANSKHRVQIQEYSNANKKEETPHPT